MTPDHFICLMLLTSLSACSAPTVMLQIPVGPAPSLAQRRAGRLIVYTATYAPTVEQSEYFVHTNYTIATPNDKVIERVNNATGTFNSKPAAVELPSGEYHVRAQYDAGGFVVVPVVIEPGKTTVVDLDGEALPQHPDENSDKVRLPDGHVVGWRATTVAQFLRGKGIPEQRIAAAGYGSTRPVASNDTAQGRQENRRVELTLTPLRQG